MHKLTVSYGKYLVCILIYSGSCSSISKFFMWLSDAVTDRKPTRHRPTRTWAGLPIQMLKKFRVKNIFPSSRKKSNNQKFWNSKKAKILIFLNPGEFRKFWFFEKISVLFGAFFHDPWGREAQWEFLPSRRRQAQARIPWHLTWLNSFLCVDFREANRTRVD